MINHLSMYLLSNSIRRFQCQCMVCETHFLCDLSLHSDVNFKLQMTCSFSFLLLSTLTPRSISAKAVKTNFLRPVCSIDFKLLDLYILVPFAQAYAQFQRKLQENFYLQCSLPVTFVSILRRSLKFFVSCFACYEYQDGGSIISSSQKAYLTWLTTRTYARMFQGATIARQA